MFVWNHRGAVAALVGVLIVVAHGVLGALAVLSAQQWLSGTAIGMAIVVAVALHAIVAHNHQRTG